jgi:hypothetical protein
MTLYIFQYEISDWNALVKLKSESSIQSLKTDRDLTNLRTYVKDFIILATGSTSSSLMGMSVS